MAGAQRPAREPPAERDRIDRSRSHFVASDGQNGPDPAGRLHALVRPHRGQRFYSSCFHLA
jgi:hypothetical protein